MVSHEQYREWDAAYVLGALDPEDRRDYERHLATCETCSRGVAELAGMPGMLSRLDVETALQIAADDATAESGPASGSRAGTAVDRSPSGAPVPPRAGSATAAAARRIRRRRRLTVLAGAAALVVVLAGGVTIGAIVRAPGGTAGAAPTETVAMASVGTSDVTASLSATGVKWGTRFDWSCAYGSDWDVPDEQYQLVVTTTEGATRTVATWKVLGTGAKNLTASTDIALDDIASVDIRYSGSEQPLASARL